MSSGSNITICQPTANTQNNTSNIYTLTDQLLRLERKFYPQQLQYDTYKKQSTVLYENVFLEIVNILTNILHNQFSKQVSAIKMSIFQQPLALERQVLKERERETERKRERERENHSWNREFI